MNPDTIIENLKSKIENNLLKLIDGPYFYTDLPYYHNTGDVLIWEGTQELLKKVPYKCLGKSSMYRFKLKKLPKNAVILLQGGGNFGDLWRQHQEFRLHIMQSYPENKIIILPQSIFYENPDMIEADAIEMAKHKNTYIFVRDESSYSILEKHFKNNMGLIPDMAFCADTDKLRKYKLKEMPKALFLKRNDKEFADAPYADFFKDIKLPLETLDWPHMKKKNKEAYLLKKVFMKKFTPHFILNYYADKYFRSSHIKKGVEFISSYQEIYTTRLHGAILSLLLGKKCVLFDNSYNKNSNFINTWLKDNDYIKMM